MLLKLQSLLKLSHDAPDGLAVDPENALPAATAAAAAKTAGSSAGTGGHGDEAAPADYAAPSDGGASMANQTEGRQSSNYAAPQDSVVDTNVGGGGYLGVGAIDGATNSNGGGGDGAGGSDGGGDGVTETPIQKSIRRAAQKDDGPYVPIGNAFQQSIRKASQTVYTPAGEAAAAAAAAAGGSGGDGDGDGAAQPRAASVYLGFVDGVASPPEATLKLGAGISEVRVCFVW